MKKKYILFGFAVLVSLCVNNSLRAQWTEISSPWGEGISDQVIANDSSLFLRNVLHLYSSSNNGRDWTEISGEIYAPRYPLLAGSTLFVVGGDSGFVYRSIDYGVHWDSACSGLPGYAIVILAGNATNLFGCGGYFTRGFVFHSTDSGANWTNSGTGLPSGDYLASLAVIGTNVFVGTYSNPSESSGHGVFRSTDSGITWKAVDVGLPANSAVSALGAIGPVLLVGLEPNGGVYRSTNNGETWDQSSSGLFSYDTVVEFAVMRSEVFVTVDAGGVYYSSDSGKTWNSSHGPRSLARSIAVTNQSVFVGGYASGLWRRPLSDFTASVVRDASPMAIELFPNPTDGIIAVHADIATHVTVENILGERLLEVATPRAPEFTLDLSKLPAGIYFARFEMEGGVVMRKIVKE
jgi:photosystem II stability/assembly factor-like uncharacterized protein